MASADFLQFVIYCGFRILPFRLQDLPEVRTTTFLPRNRHIYRTDSGSIGLCVVRALVRPYTAYYVISIRQFGSLRQRFFSLTSGFRFHLTMDTLAFG